MHGGNLAKELLALEPAVELQGWGGEKMEKAGVTIMKDYREFGIHGVLSKCWQTFARFQKTSSSVSPKFWTSNLMPLYLSTIRVLT